MKYWDSENNDNFTMQFGHGMSPKKTIKVMFTEKNIIIQIKEQKHTETKE